MSTTAQDLITSALRQINQYAPGESLDSADATDALETLNDLLESLSTDQASVFASIENVLSFTPNQYIYTIGNYDAGQFAGIVTSGSATITGATVPADMVINGDLSGAGIADGTTILSFNAIAGTVTMSQVGISNPGTQQIGYTIPGDFKIQRPLRVTDSFTRLTTSGSSLDYPIEVIDEGKYIQIGYKAISAPWPIVVWYNPTFPLGTLYFYQNPSGGGELHLFTDTVLQNLPDLTTEVVMPQGYSRFLKRALARELAPEYGSIWTQQQERLYMESYNFVKSLNMVPTPVSNYDADIVRSQKTSAGWILSGGFANT